MKCRSLFSIAKYWSTLDDKRETINQNTNYPCKNKKLFNELIFKINAKICIKVKFNGTSRKSNHKIPLFFVKRGKRVKIFTAFHT